MIVSLNHYLNQILDVHPLYENISFVSHSSITVRQDPVGVVQQSQVWQSWKALPSSLPPFLPACLPLSLPPSLPLSLPLFLPLSWHTCVQCQVVSNTWSIQVKSYALTNLCHTFVFYCTFSFSLMSKEELSEGVSLVLTQNL